MKEILETCIKAYQDAIEFIKGEHDKEVIHCYLAQNELLYGLCSFVRETFVTDEYLAFEDMFMSFENTILFAWQSPHDFLYFIKLGNHEFYSQDLIKTCLQPRLYFLKEKLIELEKEVEG